METKSFNIALFGEAEKGEFNTAYFCNELAQLVDFLGNPPAESHGLYFAVQALHYGRQIIFIRVKEEGFSRPDYEYGLQLLHSQRLISPISAIALPGVGDEYIFKAAEPICILHHSILLTTEADLFDFLTSRAAA